MKKDKKRSKISNADRKRLITLSYDFLLYQRDDIYIKVREIIENCNNYEDGRREIMKIYNDLYM